MIIEKNYKKINYLIYFPDGYDENLKYPLILDIQGAGSRGNNLELLKIGGPIYELTQGRKLPFIVVAPQCYVDTWFEIFEQLLEFIENLINKTFIDKKECIYAEQAWEVTRRGKWQ